MSDIKVNILIVAFLFNMAFFTVPVAAQVVHRVGTYDVESPSITLTINVMTRIYEALGWTLIIERYPGRRSLVTANSGQIDGELTRNVSIEAEYKNLIRVPVSHSTTSYSVFVTDNTLKINTWEDLAPYSMGLFRGLKLTEIHTQGFNRVFSNSIEHLFKLLQYQRVDLVVFPTFDGLVAVNRLGLTRIITSLAPPLTEAPDYFYLHKKHKNLIQKLSNKMKKMKETGELNRLRDNEMAKIMEAW